MRLSRRLQQESYNLLKIPLLSTSEEMNIQFYGTTIKSSQCIMCAIDFWWQIRHIENKCKKANWKLIALLIVTPFIEFN